MPYYHVSPAYNRTSIRKTGLQPRKTDYAFNQAKGKVIFLLDDLRFIHNVARDCGALHGRAMTFDVWRVKPNQIELRKLRWDEPGEVYSEWSMSYPDPIPANGLSLAQTFEFDPLAVMVLVIQKNSTTGEYTSTIKRMRDDPEKMALYEINQAEMSGRKLSIRQIKAILAKAKAVATQPTPRRRKKNAKQ